MADRVPSDHTTVETHRISVESVGRTDRLRLELSDVDVVPRSVVRLTIGGSEYHAQVETTLDGTLVIASAHDNARLARTDGEGEDRLAAWLTETGLVAGRSVLLDELLAGTHYGLRQPGERIVYTVREPPEDSLTDIARDLDG